MTDKEEIYAFPTEKISHYVADFDGHNYGGTTNFAKPVFIKDGGMLLRDYFAAKAMQGMLSRDSQGGWCPSENESKKPCGVKRVAKFAYEYADAMLEARNK